MARSKGNPGRLTQLQVKFRGLAIEDGARETAEALAANAGLPAKPARPRKSSRQFPFETALRQQLVEIEARLGVLVEQLPDALVVCNGSGTLLLANARCEALFGHAPEVLLGRSISAILSGPFVTEIVEHGARSALEHIGESRWLGIDLVGLRADGSTFAAETLAQPLESVDEPLLVLSPRDASARRAKEKRLVEDRDRLGRLLDAEPGVLIEVNRHGRILFANHRCMGTFGYEPEEIVGQTISRVLPDLDAAQIYADHGAREADQQQRGIHKDGTSLDLVVRTGMANGDSGASCVVLIREADTGEYAGSAAAVAFAGGPDAMMVVDGLGLVQLINRQAESLFGYEADEIVGQSVTTVLPEGFIDRLNAGERGLTEAALARETGAAIAVAASTKAGRRLELEMQLAPLDGRVVATFRTAQAGTGREAVSERRLPDPSFAEVTLGSIGDALVCIDLNGSISFMNDAAERLTGWSWQAARGRPLEDVIRMLDPATQTAARGPAMQLPLSLVMVRRDGRAVPIEGSIAPIEGHDGVSIGRVLLFRDASQSHARAEQIAHSAQHDPLTGLPNRVLLNDRIRTAISIAPRHQKKVGVLFLDLDGFKRVNDTLGHAVGDKLLQVVAERLMTCVRSSDTVSRIGGDEFVVLLSEVERAEDSAITARRMLEAISETYAIDRHELNVTVSIGMSVYPDDGIDAETLIKNADAAMYQAKENGRKGYQFYKPAMNLRAIERQDIEDSLRNAIGREEFALHFQPKVNLHTGEIAGAEALLRWEHPTRGPMSPALFMPVAEASGLIQPIGGWVLREACRQAQIWRKAGLMLPVIAINISGVQFANGRFVDGVFDVLSDTGLDPRALELELNESALMKEADHADSILRALDAGGIRMSVDDFGTGYSNLDHLRKFPIHTLKIDQSFVREITIAEADASVVTMVLSMARSLHLRVAAEGVETAQELEFLQLHHCDEAQGFYFSRPLPAPQFTRLLKEGLVPTMAARRASQSFGRLHGHALPPVA